VAIFASGLAINKCIAIFSGPMGIALFGVIKNFHLLVGSILKVGADTVIISQAAKTTNSPSLQKDLLGSILKLGLLQVIAIFFAMLFLEEVIYKLVFSSVLPESFSWIIQIILALVLMTVFAEMIASFFNGLLDLRKVFISSLSGSLLTMTLAIVLKPTSYLALSFLALSSGFFSALILGFFLIKNFPTIPCIQFRGIRSSFSNFPISITLSINPLLVALSFLTIQNLISTVYGLDALATFILCSTLISAMLTLIMSSARMYFLPKLGSLTDPQERNSFFQMNVYFYLLATSLTLIFVILFAESIIYILYSDEFLAASGLLVLRASTMILMSFFWVVAVSAWEKNRFTLFIIPEAIREALYVLSCFACVYYGLSLEKVFLGFIFSEVITSFFWVGYLNFYKSELRVNSMLLIMIYLVTFLLIYFAYNSL
jgi:hypothetical protein